MRQGLLKNTTFYTIGNILPKIGSFFLIPIYSAYMSPNEYGIVYSLQALVSLLTVAFTLSMPKAIFRLFHDYSGLEKKKEFISSLFNTVFLISLGAFLLSLLFSNIISGIYKNIEFYPYFLYSLIFILFNSFETIPKTLLQVEQKAGLFVLINLVQFLLKNGLIVLFVVKYNKGAEGYLLGQMISAAIVAPVLLYMIRAYLSFSLNKNIIKSTLVFSLPMIPGNISAWVLNLSDRIFIDRFFSSADVGIYSMGYQIAGVALIFSSSIKKAFDPHFFSIAGKLDYEEARSRLQKDIRVFIYVVLAMVFFIAFFSKELILLFVDSRYHGAYQIVPIISLAYFISHLSGYYNLMFYQEKKSKGVMYIILIGALINIALNAILIPKFGIQGAAWATVTSFLIICVIKDRYSRKYFYIPVSYGKMFVFVGIAAVFIVFGNNLDCEPIMALIFKALVTFVMFAIAFFKYKGELMKLLKKGKR